MSNKKIIFIAFVLALVIIPRQVNAALCKTIPLDYEFKWCHTGDMTKCYNSFDDIPDNINEYRLVETIKKICPEGYTEKDNMCVQTTNCTTQQQDLESNLSVELIDSDQNCEESANYEFKTSVSESGSVSLGCFGSANYTCTAIISSTSNYKFYFKDYDNKPIKSLIDDSRSTQYAPGTGTTFQVLYDSNLNYSVSYESDSYTFTVGHLVPYQRCWEDCWECGGGGGGPVLEVPATCSVKPTSIIDSDIPATTMDTCCETECETYYVCEPYRTVTIDCSGVIGNISVEAVKAEDNRVTVNYVNATTQTTKENKTQYLGNLKDNGTTNTTQKYQFNVPEAYINIKDGQILYKGITYNGQNTELWKKVTNGYYIPTNAIPEKETIVKTGIGGTAYVVKVDGVAIKNININGELNCPFESKIPGCPVEPCEPIYYGKCNPNTDQYKCCRNVTYLEENPNYYEKACIYDGYGYSNLYRQISLNNPFPNRDAGENWYNWINKKENQERLENSYENLEYSVSLTPSLIQKIREYNEKSGNEYTSWTQMNDDGSSQFLKDTNEVSMQVTKSADVEYYKLGCGPSNEDMEWCK